MDTTDNIDDLTDDLGNLDSALEDTGALTSAFAGQLRQVQTSLGETTRDLGALERGFSTGLRQAFDGVLLGGQSLSDALTGLAQKMADTAYSAAMNPVANHFGGMLADGLNAAVSGMLPFADGGAFSQGRVMPFAKGGVVSGATAFPMRGGIGLMGEAGPEAIMPLTRGPDGRLGVASTGGAGAVNVTMQISTPDAPSFQRSSAQIAAKLSRAMARGQRHR